MNEVVVGACAMQDNSVTTDGDGETPAQEPAEGRGGSPGGHPPRQNYPQYGYGPLAYPPPGSSQPGYPQSGYSQPGPFQAWPGPHGAVPPGPGWGVPAPEVKVGIVPIRPLELGAIYNGAFAAIRANPAIMVGFTVVFVVVTQLLTFVAQVPLTRMPTDPEADDAEFFAALGWSTALSMGFALAAGVVTMLLMGLLTATVARSVLGERVGAGQAMRAVAPRIPALIGLSILQTLFLLIPAALIVGGALGVTLSSIDDNTGLVVGTVIAAVGLFLLLIVAGIALMPAFSLSFQAVVLERLGPIAALRRAFDLQRRGYWRLLGILLLTAVIVGVVSSIVSGPFAVGGLAIDGGVPADTLVGASTGSLAVSTVGSAIALMVTAPFSAGVSTLLYVDQRMRSEGLYHALRAEAIHRLQTGTPGVPADDIWLAADRAPRR